MGGRKGGGGMGPWFPTLASAKRTAEDVGPYIRTLSLLPEEKVVERSETG